MSPPSAHRSLPWLAAAGLLGGHAISTWLVRGSSHGAGLHGYLEGSLQIGVIAAVVGLTALLTGRLVRADRALPATGPLGARLAVLQVTALVAMETGERLAAGAPLSDLVWVLPVGGLVQVVLALVAGLAIGWLFRTTARIMAAATPARAPAVRLAWALPVSARSIPAASRTSTGARAPPP
jgi:hypothetical protein